MVSQDATTGVDCAAPLPPADVAAIDAGMETYGVLVFRNQPLSDAQQLGFTLHFGKLEKYATPGDVRKPGERRLGAGMADLSNLMREPRHVRRGSELAVQAGRPALALRQFLPPRDRQIFIAVRPGDPPGAAIPNSLICAPPMMRSTIATKAEIEDSVCEHSLIYSRGSIGFAEMTPEEKENFRPVRHNLVRRDPQTGRKSLFLASHAGAIVGWTISEARMLLRDLTEHATQPQFVSSSSLEAE